MARARSEEQAWRATEPKRYSITSQYRKLRAGARKIALELQDCRPNRGSETLGRPSSPWPAKRRRKLGASAQVTTRSYQLWLAFRSQASVTLAWGASLCRRGGPPRQIPARPGESESTGVSRAALRCSALPFALRSVQFRRSVFRSPLRRSVWPFRRAA